MMWGPSRWCRHNGDDTGMTWGPWGRCGDHGDHGDMGWRPQRQWRPRRPQVMGTTWGPSGGYGDDVGTMGMTHGWRGQRGDHGDNKIIKNAITFEQIEIIEFRLKIWDPWTLPHTCRLQLMCRWGMSYPKWHFYPKSTPVTLKKFFSLFLYWIPLDHI